MKIFLIEKDRQFRELTGRILLENTDHEVRSFESSVSISYKQAEAPDLLIINCSQAIEEGGVHISQVESYLPETYVLLVCHPEFSSIATHLLDKGVFDFIVTGKGFSKKLLNAVKNINALSGLRSENNRLKSHISRKYDASSAIIGESNGIKRVLALVEKAVSVQNITVSIHGESGTGKGLVARTIHFNSVRKESPFITLNLGAIPDELVESELFGHETGSMPGAYSRQAGKLEEANLGTLFITDIADLDINLQSKLLQAIQDKVVRRVGSNKGTAIDTRIITATTKDLTAEVKKGRFREDLYYRLLGLPIMLPPLLERGNDIILLANHFLNNFCRENNQNLKEFSGGALNKLLKHNFPGNVRELNAIVELAAVLSNNQFIEEEHILFSPTHSGLDVFNTEIPLREFEIRIIRHFLEKYNNNVVLVAKKLEIGKSKIYNMIKNGEL